MVHLYQARFVIMAHHRQYFSMFRHRVLQADFPCRPQRVINRDGACVDASMDIF